MMVWQDWTSLNKKYNDAWLAGLGGGVFDSGSVLGIGLGQTAAEDLSNIIWWGQIWTNEQLAALGLRPIQADGVMRPEFCGALSYLVEMAMAQLVTLNEEFTDWAGEYGHIVEPLCTPLAKPAPLTASGQPAVVPTTTQQTQTQPQTQTTAPTQTPVYDSPPTTPPTTTTTPTTPAPGAAMQACKTQPNGTVTCDCYIYEGDTGPHIEHYQQALNAALVAADYEPIVVTGAWDKETCGAVFTLYGSFTYDPMDNPYCQGQDFIFPVECPGMILPTKSGAKTSRASMFAVGGLLLAAGLGTAYWVSKR